MGLIMKWSSIYGSVNKLSVPFIWLDENQYTSHTPKYPFVMTCIMYMSTHVKPEFILSYVVGLILGSI